MKNKDNEILRYIKTITEYCRERENCNGCILGKTKREDNNVSICSEIFRNCPDRINVMCELEIKSPNKRAISSRKKR